MFGMVTLAFVITSVGLVVAISTIMLITRTATRVRTMTIACVAISVLISSGSISRTIGQQAYGLTIIRVSEVMARA